MKKTIGFSLIEVLVSMTILSIGLLGLAGLQVAGLKNNQNAFYYSQATQLLYDISDRMHANAPNAVKTTPTTSPYLIALGASKPAAVSACSTTAGCTPAQMAQNDLNQWKTALATTLPGGDGSITVNGFVYTVTINWDDNHDGVVDTNDANFTMSFQL